MPAKQRRTKRPKLSTRERRLLIYLALVQASRKPRKAGSAGEEE